MLLPDNFFLHFCFFLSLPLMCFRLTSAGALQTALCLLAVTRNGLSEKEICEIFGLMRSGAVLPLVEWAQLFDQISVFVRTVGYCSTKTHAHTQSKEQKLKARAKIRATATKVNRTTRET